MRDQGFEILPKKSSYIVRQVIYGIVYLTSPAFIWQIFLYCDIVAISIYEHFFIKVNKKINV